MIEIAVKYLERVTGARPWTGNADRVCRGVEIDSRHVQKDSIFVAFPGERVDGAVFAPDAIRAGASAVVLCAEPSHELVRLADEYECAIFSCEDPTEFLLLLAQGYRARMKPVVVAITGSIGKTTTKDALAAMLATRFRVWATKGNRNSLIGLPLTILSAPRDTQVLVVEMGMDRPGQIERLSRCAQPTYAVITKIGTSHVGMLGDREHIARAKAEILLGMSSSSLNFEGHHSALILGGEDDFTPYILENFANPAGVEPILCGFSPDDDVSVRSVELDELGRPTFEVMFEDGALFKMSAPLLGAQAVPNITYAAAVAHRLGIPRFEISQALSSLSMTGRRTEMRVTPQGTRIIDDSYNAAPESMAAALDLLGTLDCSGRRCAVLGEMGELGDQASYLHGLTAAYAAAKDLDLLVFVGDQQAKAMAEAAQIMGMSKERVCVLSSAEAAAERFAGSFMPDDLILVKASRFVGLDRFVEEVCSC